MNTRTIRIRYVLPVALAAVAYFLAGYFIDLPPYGIWLKASETRIALDGALARVDVRLSYACTSWRPRRTSVYLPVSHAHGEGPVRDLQTDLKPPSSYRSYSDGVVLQLAMGPYSEQTVRFQFSQEISGKSFECIFGAPRGWPLPPNLITYVVEVPASPLRYRFSIPPLRQEAMAGGKIMGYNLNGVEGKGLVISWE